MKFSEELVTTLKHLYRIAKKESEHGMSIGFLWCTCTHHLTVDYLMTLGEVLEEEYTGEQSDRLKEALQNLYGVGEDCKRCKWDPNDMIWSNGSNIIKVKHLLALSELIGGGYVS